MPIKGLTFAGGFYSGYLGKDIAATLPNVQHRAERWDFVAAYVLPDMFRVGVEYFHADDYNQVTAVPTDTSDGYSFWGSYSFTPKISVFARYDNSNPSKKLAPTFEEHYYNLGLAYNFRKNVDVSLVYKHETVQHGALNSSNGVITGGNAGDGRYDEIGLWSQVKF